MSPLNGNSQNFILTSIWKKFVYVCDFKNSYFALGTNPKEEMLFNLHQMGIFITLMHQRDDRKI